MPCRVFSESRDRGSSYPRHLTPLHFERRFLRAAFRDTVPAGHVSQARALQHFFPRPEPVMERAMRDGGVLSKIVDGKHAFLQKSGHSPHFLEQFFVGILGASQTRVETSALASFTPAPESARDSPDANLGMTLKVCDMDHRFTYKLRDSPNFIEQFFVGKFGMRPRPNVQARPLACFAPGAKSTADIRGANAAMFFRSLS